MGKSAVISLFADKALVLIFPALPAGLSVEDPVSLLQAASRDLREKALAQLSGPAHDDKEGPGKEKQIEFFQSFAFDIRVVPQGHAVGNSRGDLQAIILQHLHQRPAAVGEAVEDIHPAAVGLQDIVLQLLGFPGNGAKLRLRLGGVEAVIGNQNYVVLLRDLLCSGKNTEIAGPAAMEKNHQFLVFLSEFKIFHRKVNPLPLIVSSHQGHKPPHQSGGDQREDNAGKQHALCVKPLLVIGLVHMLGAFQPKHRKIGKQHPIKETGVIDADPHHQAKSKPKALPEGFCSGSQCTDQQDSGKEKHAEAFGEQYLFGTIAYIDLFMRLEVFLLYVGRIVVDARRTVLPAAAVCGKKNGCEDRRKDDHFDQDDPDTHIQTSV